MKFKLLLFVILLFSLNSIAQKPVGQWINYQSYRSATKAIDTGNLVYCVTEGGLFTYNKSDNSIQKLSRINGLSDVGAHNIGYSESTGTVLISYENSNIDLIFENDIFNLSDIKRKQIMGDKSINKITFMDELAYLSCGFGIVVVNTEKKEIKDTYYIAEGGGPLNVLDVAIDNSNIYAATEEGIYKASINEPNLQDYSKWNKITDLPYPDETYTNVEFFNNQIIVSYSPANGDDELYSYNGTSWIKVFLEIKKVYDLNAQQDQLIITNNGDVYIFNTDGSLKDKIYQYIFSEDNQSNGIDPRSCSLGSNGEFWVCDNDYGLVKRIGWSAEKISPQGPSDNSAFSLFCDDENLLVSSGGYDASWSNLWTNASFQKKDINDNWTQYTAETVSEMQGFHDMVCMVSDPTNPQHIYAGSWGSGIFEFENDEFKEHYDYNNSSLQTAITGSDQYIRIGGMTFDNEGTLWVTNSGVSNILSSFSNGNWESYNIPDLANKYNLGDIVITENGDKWIALSPRNKDIYVLKSDNTTGKWQKNVAYFTNGTDETTYDMHEVYCMVIDQDGAIWVGSSAGVGVYDDPSRIWNDATTDPLAKYARQPGLDLNDGIYHPLLSNETVTAIAVDGANRKWCGTKNSGAFLVSEDGEEELEHFTVDNSPLLDNEILDIAINNTNGEIFFATSKGIISYIGEAIESQSSFSDVYVYPNPVREDYDGPVVIKGLMEDSDVKITDISGNLVYHATSTGGQASWDGNNLNGNRCHTGVYLVFLNDKRGQETFATKILFIH